MPADPHVRHLRGIDAYHLYEETPARPTHTIKVLRLEPSVPGQRLELGELREHLRERLGEHDLLRSIFVPVPGRLYHPAIVDLGMPDLGVHVQELPHGARELERGADVAGELASTPLPRDRPLWRVSLGPHPEGGAQAIFIELGHTLADGQASAWLLESLFGASGREPAGRALPNPRVPSRGAIARSGARSLARSLAHFPRYVGRSLGGTREAKRGQDEAATVRPFAGPTVPWGGKLEHGRSVAYLSLELAGVHKTRSAFGATVGDMVLGYVGRAAESHLRKEGGSLPRPLTAVVPVGSRSRVESVTGNRHHHTFAPLATDVPDLSERAARISAAMRRNVMKTTDAALDAWENQLEYYPLFRAFYLATVVPVGRLLHRPPASMIVSTVRGPQKELHVGPMRVSTVHSIGVLTEHLGLNVTAWSYQDQLSVTVLMTQSHKARAVDIAREITSAAVEFAEAASAQAGVST